MALKRIFGIRFGFLLAFGLFVVFLQMLALSRLSLPTLSKFPWEDNQGSKREVKAYLTHDGFDDEVGNKYLEKDKVRNEVISVKDKENFKPSSSLLSSISYLNPFKTLTYNLTTPSTSSKRDVLVLPETKSIRSYTPLPLPSELQRTCDKIIETKKDALSAITRATSDDCKTFIRNITCLQQSGRVYHTDIKNECLFGKFSGKVFQYLPYSLGTGPPIRVVYLLSVHGRAFRQVKRLFKAIFHTDHYFYVHVDSRSDYLHRRLYEELSDLPNVYFPSWRMATMWGGASLLQMLLRAIEDLEFVLTDWNWDYFINMSESDYPIRTNKELVQFLRVHRGNNFVKTHGGDINKFIQKQGLDRTFIECDSHMWRVDTRPLPPDITIDGGSDWIVLHRNYTHYLVTDESYYLTSLKKYYQFSLLPAESFFHTVLRNGPMCESFVRSNLRVTNWNRKLGCLCQYKHIVDWCGCSPNDFKVKDITGLKNPGNHHFFARKFEAIVSQEVILQLDSHLFGALPDNTPSLRSHWESVYHNDDDITRPSNARYSTYQSFLRLSLKLLYSEQTAKSGESGVECGIPKQAVVNEIHVLREKDQFRGCVVTLKDALSESFDPPEFELIFTRVSHSTSFLSDGDLTKRIIGLEVGSEWDGKESMFRNYPGILGAWDEPVASIRLTPGRQGDVNIIWDDPVGEQVANFPIKLESSWHVSHHKPKMERPIRPGVWIIRLALPDGTLLIQTKFLVVPITHENKDVLELPQTINAKRSYTVKPNLDVKVFGHWKNNVSKTGTQLEQWMDEMVKEYWTIDGYCRMDVGQSGGDRCSWIQDCKTTSWSTFSPDPKTELGEVRTNGRIR